MQLKIATTKKNLKKLSILFDNFLYLYFLDQLFYFRLQWSKYQTWKISSCLFVYRGLQIKTMLNYTLIVYHLGLIGQSQIMCVFSFPVIGQGPEMKWLRHSLQLSRFPTYIFTFYTHKSQATHKLLVVLVFQINRLR